MDLNNKFDVNKWLKGVNVWLEEYDYVTHETHWLTSKWSAKCEKCLAQRKSSPRVPVLLSRNQDLIDLNETFDLYKSALADTPGGPLTDHDFNPISLHDSENSSTPAASAHMNHNHMNHHHHHMNHHMNHLINHHPMAFTQPVSSRIPRIPVRSATRNQQDC